MADNGGLKGLYMSGILRKQYMVTDTAAIQFKCYKILNLTWFGDIQEIQFAMMEVDDGACDLPLAQIQLKKINILRIYLIKWHY